MAKKFALGDILNKSSMNEIVRVQYKIEHVDRSLIDPSPMNDYSIDEIEELAASILMTGLGQNLELMQKDNGRYDILSGERRFRATGLLYDDGHQEYKNLPATIAQPKDDIEAELILHERNRHRKFTVKDTAFRVGRYKYLFGELKKRGEKLPGRVRDLIAAELDMSPSQVNRYDSINKNLSPELKGIMDNKGADLTTTYEASRLTQEEQEEAAEKYKRSGSLTKDDIKEIKSSSTTSKVVKTKEVKRSGEQPEAAEAKPKQEGSTDTLLGQVETAIKERQIRAMNVCGDIRLVDTSTGEFIVVMEVSEDENT